MIRFLQDASYYTSTLNWAHLRVIRNGFVSWMCQIGCTSHVCSFITVKRYKTSFVYCRVALPTSQVASYNVQWEMTGQLRRMNREGLKQSCRFLLRPKFLRLCACKYCFTNIISNVCKSTTFRTIYMTSKLAHLRGWMNCFFQEDIFQIGCKQNFHTEISNISILKVIKVYANIYLERLGEQVTSSIRRAHIPAEIRSQNLLHMKEEW
jgi:hypothetical protein